MSRLHPTLLTVVAILAFQGPTVSAGDEQSSPDDWYRSVYSVAGPLARQGVPAGVVMCHLPPASPGEPAEDRLRHAGTPALAICRELNGSLVQSRVNGVLHVRTSQEPRHVTELLNRSIEVEAAADVPAIEAVATKIVNAVRGDHSKGKSGSTGPTSQLVTLRGGRTTLTKALDDVVRQAPGLVWWITFLPEDEGGYMIGLAGPQGGSGVNLLPIPPTPLVVVTPHLR